MPPTSPPPLLGHTDDAPKPQTMSRGALLSQLIRQRATGRGAGGTGSSATDTSGDEGSVRKLSAAGGGAAIPPRGRGELMMARAVGTVTTQPEALPL